MQCTIPLACRWFERDDNDRVGGVDYFGGVKRIAVVSSIIVPFMAIFYVAISVVIIIINWQQVPAALSLIIHSAFDLQAALGGALGITVMKAI